MNIAKNAGRVTALVVGTTVLAMASAGGADRRQYVAFERPVVDVGTVREGEEVRVHFGFRNAATSAATLMSVEAGCGVWAPSLRNQMLAGGESGEIEARVHTEGYQSVFLGSITVRLKDPDERTVLLQVKGTVDREFVPDSKIVDFGRVAEDMVSREIRIHLNRTREEVIGVRSTDDNFEVRLSRDERTKVPTVIVSTRPGGSPGLKFGTIRISTSSPHMPELVVPVRAVVTRTTS